jgi:hypothetical protein
MGKKIATVAQLATALQADPALAARIKGDPAGAIARAGGAAADGCVDLQDRRRGAGAGDPGHRGGSGPSGGRSRKCFWPSAPGLWARWPVSWRRAPPAAQDEKAAWNASRV